MDNLKMHSLDGVQRNIELIGKLFPNAITEVKRNGKVEHAIDFDVLRQELSDSIVEGREERYQFTWPDKKKAMLAANAPITATLRPVVADSVGKDGTPGGFDSENLYIEGDNLEVLKLLQETYLGKVKMIYIDPPYNTGNDFVYEDDFAQSTEDYMENSGQYDEEGNRLVTNTESNGRFHTDWLNMIYPRLKIAKDLLTDDGVIFISIDDNVGHSQEGAQEVSKLLDGGFFSGPKPQRLMQRLLTLANLTSDSIVLDFFSGSASTAHAVMSKNAENGGHRKFIMVQLPEKTDEKSEAYKAGYKNICEIGKERIRRAGRKIKEDAGLTAPADLDIGFRCLRLDESNMKPVYYTPDEVGQQDLFSLVDNVKEDRTPEDLLFQVMLDLGVLLSSSIEVKEIAGKKVFNVADGFLLACFDHDVTEETVKAIAQMKPYYAVFRDSSMANDSVATNFDQIFETYSPDTVRKVL